jgi:DNA ligase-1
MQKFAECAEGVAATTKKLQKRAIVAEYLKSLSKDEAAVATVFLSGRAFAAWEEMTLQVGGTILWKTVAAISGKSEGELTAAYRRHGDLGAVAGEVLPVRDEQGVGILEVEKIFRQIAEARGAAAKGAVVRDLLGRARPVEAKYIIKIMTGDLRIGLKESLVEDAIAEAYGATLAEVQRANMLLGDIGEALRLAVESRLGEAKMRMFHPLGFMLASPVESAADGLSYFAEAAVEDKYDGMRAQAHVSGGEVRFYSRTRDEITESFPELPDALAGLRQEVILDGEIVAWEYPEELEPESKPKVVDETLTPEAEEKAAGLGRARPFTFLQQRLGRKKVSEELLRDVPVAFVAFDVLYADGELLIDRPLAERARILDGLMESKNLQHRGQRASLGKTQTNLSFDNDGRFSPSRVIRAPAFRAASEDELELLFTAAQERGNEGLMIKDLTSAYLPGKRGKAWLKMKRELATLDVVVTAVEYGHGRRVSVLSDYTFAVWDAEKERLVNIGKAYSGLTDAEIVEMTRWFLEHTIEDQGFRRTVEPTVVLEVAFNNMMRSERHESGYALRFPRIVRLRPDKLASEADTIERVKEIYRGQEKKSSS